MPDDFTHQLKGILRNLWSEWVNQSKTISLPLTHWLPGVPHWRVKSSGVRQSKILSLAGLGRFGRQRVNPFWLLRMRFIITDFTLTPDDFTCQLGASWGISGVNGLNRADHPGRWILLLGKVKMFTRQKSKWNLPLSAASWVWWKVHCIRLIFDYVLSETWFFFN